MVDTLNRRKYLLENLGGYPSLSELRRSEFFLHYRAEMESILSVVEVYNCPSALPRLRAFTRVVQWNIEKGKGFQTILAALERDEVLKWADFILLNEADCGMNRSGNRHVARHLAESLGMSMAFAPAHLELTKGTGDDLDWPGENRESVQGNAILSRYPILEARVLPLPQCFEPYEFQEKRYGRSNCVWVRVRIGSRSVWIASAHLEVRNTPRCRALQMRHILRNLPGGGDSGFILGGDFNTNGFARGTRWRTIGAVSRLLARSPAVLKEVFRHPEKGPEPLFRLVERHGFSWAGLNSGEDTACAPLDGLEDAGMLPNALVRLVQRRLAAYEGQLCFKLDWLLGRSVQPLGKGEVRDMGAGVSSLAAGCVPLIRCGSERASDHRPIYADLRF